MGKMMINYGINFFSIFHCFIYFEIIAVDECRLVFEFFKKRIVQIRINYGSHWM